MANFLVIGTWNTKGEELEFVCQELARGNHNPIRLDLSATRSSKDRNTALLSVVGAAKEKLTTLARQQRISGAVSVGGGTNSPASACLV